MTPLTDTNMAQETRYETPTFDPRGAFAWTLRGGEMARSEHPARQKEVAASSELGGSGSNKATPTNGTERHYETPTFDPRGAFARTLRGGEMARLERRRRLFDQERPDALVCASWRLLSKDAAPLLHNTESRVGNLATIAE